MSEEKISKKLNELIDKHGAQKVMSLTNMSAVELYVLTNRPIEDPEVAYDLIIELFTQNKLPKRYNGFNIDIDSMVGTLSWTRDAVVELMGKTFVEGSLSYATPFWDGDSFIPIDTNYYELRDLDGKVITTEEDEDFYSQIDVEMSFENIEQLLIWYKDFYLPKTSSKIKKHLEGYRDLVEGSLVDII
jgi:hypothetical protein